MPLTLERVSVLRATGLPRIVGYNENHDELGRFAEGDGPGGFTKDDHHSLMKQIDSAPLAAVNEKIDRAMEKISQGTPKQVISFAKEIGIAGLKSKSEALTEIRNRYESRWENALNTRFHATGAVCATGLPRIVGYNENHDELGRFAESAGGGGGEKPSGSGDRASKKLARFKELTANPPAPKIDREAIRELIQVQKLSPDQIRKDILDGSIDRGSVSRNEAYVDKVYRLAERASDREGNINGKPHEDLASDAVDRFLSTVADAAYAQANEIARGG